MKYTTSKQSDKKVDEDMKIICKEVLEKIKGTEMILLTGGFSRGEGPVKKIGEKFFPYNDYDIQVISSNKVTKEEVDKISTEISEKLGYKGISNFYPFKKDAQKMKENFYLDLKCDDIEDLKKLLPRIRTYELKNKSLILWEKYFGTDLRQNIPDYDLKNIPLSEGAKLILDRMSQLIEYYSIEKKYDKEFLTYIIQQAYAACCTSLLLLTGKYEIGYVNSMRILNKTYKQDFPELYSKIPELSKKIEEFILWKINPQKIPNEDVEEEWFVAKYNIIEVAKYFFSKFLNKKIEDVDDLAKAILGMKKEFYSPYIKEMIKRKVKLLGKVGNSKLLASGASIILNKNYNKRLKEMGIPFKTSFFKSPDLAIFSSLVYFIDSIHRGNKIAERELNEGEKILSLVYPVKGKNWEELSLDYANAYIAFFLQKI
jgi:hypothetical protein